MFFINFITRIFDIFNSSKKDNILVGLSQLRESKEPVLQEVQKPKSNKNTKLSDLIKGENY